MFSNVIFPIVLLVFSISLLFNQDIETFFITLTLGLVLSMVSIILFFHMENKNEKEIRAKMKREHEEYMENLNKLYDKVFEEIKKSRNNYNFFESNNENQRTKNNAYENETLKALCVIYNTTDLKTMDELTKSLNINDVNRQYKRRAKEVHPDMAGGSVEKFQKLNNAKMYIDKVMKTYQT